MPQYDPNPAILEERCYAMARDIALVSVDPDEYSELTDDQLARFRENVRSTLLSEFPDIEGPLIGEIMDDALVAECDFPMDRV